MIIRHPEVDINFSKKGENDYVLIKENLICSGNNVIERDKNKLIFQGKETVKLNASQSAIVLLKDRQKRLKQVRNECIYIVEGERTEMSVYPAWMSLIAPNVHQIDNPYELSSDSYYLFSGHGQPSVFQHVSGAIQDINAINSPNRNKYDYLVVCVDTENETREYIRQQINKYIQNENVTLSEECQLVLFEQNVCMETLFLGNRKIFKTNPSGEKMVQYLHYYNVKDNDPEYMGAFDDERYTKAQFHVRYLKEMLKKRKLKYEKNDTSVVCTYSYLNEIIKRYKETEHLQTFGSWYEFIKNNLGKPEKQKDNG